MYTCTVCSTGHTRKLFWTRTSLACPEVVSEMHPKSTVGHYVGWYLEGYKGANTYE